MKVFLEATAFVLILLACCVVFADAVSQHSGEHFNMNLTISTRPPLTAPANFTHTNKNASTNFTWNASSHHISDAGFYGYFKLQLDNDTDFSSPVFNITINGTDSCSNGVCNYTYEPELPDSWYYWRVAHLERYNCSDVNCSRVADYRGEPEFVEGDFSYWGTGVNNDTDWSTRTLVIDTVNPIPYCYLPSYMHPHTCDENITEFDRRWYLNLSCNDYNLYGMFVNITSSNGTQKFTYSKEGISGNEYNYVHGVNTGKWPEGEYFLKLVCSDDHTAMKIADIPYRTWGNKVIFNITPKHGKRDVSFSITPMLPVSKEDVTVSRNIYPNIVKKKYKYEIGYNFSEVVDPKEKLHEYKFIILSDYKIRYREKSKYKGHFVIGRHCYDEGSNCKWLDFHKEAEGGAMIKVQKLDKKSGYAYEVTLITNRTYIDPEIGGLNYATKYWKVRIKHKQTPLGSKKLLVLAGAITTGIGVYAYYRRRRRRRRR